MFIKKNHKSGSYDSCTIFKETVHSKMMVQYNSVESKATWDPTEVYCIKTQYYIILYIIFQISPFMLHRRNNK